MTKLARIIADEIRAGGPISAARFMELALYCPVYGYYERERDILGSRGDYYTSVSTGPLFGQMLAWYFAGLQAFAPASRSLQLIEAGAHDGRLALDILTWLREHRSSLFSNLNYTIIEPSARRQQWQRVTTEGFPVQWLNDIRELPSQFRAGDRTVRILFCNELVDAFPVHRIGWDATVRQWFEWGVTLDPVAANCGANLLQSAASDVANEVPGQSEPRFAWTRLRSCSHGLQLPVLPEKLLTLLPDGFTTEAAGPAARWWGAAAEAIQSGWLVTFDYGFESEDFFAPHRLGGTLRSYRKHRVSGDVLSNPGDQDITSHVNFTQLIAIGKNAGLTTETYLDQSRFLTRLLAGAIQDPAFQPWNSERTRQFQSLAHPEHLGRAFSVLVQKRSPVLQ